MLLAWENGSTVRIPDVINVTGASACQRIHGWPLMVHHSSFDGRTCGILPASWSHLSATVVVSASRCGPREAAACSASST